MKLFLEASCSFAFLLPLWIGIQGANAQAPITSCDFMNDACPSKSDTTCDVTDDGMCDGGVTSDCFDCDPCKAYSYVGCSECTSNGCVWCPGDALCSSVPLTQDWFDSNSPLGARPDLIGKDYLAPLGVPAWPFPAGVGLQTTCPTSEEWLAECPAGTGTGTTDALQWYHDVLNVAAVWEEGITGAGVHIRVNDVGTDAEHPDLAPNFDVENSCEEYLPAYSFGLEALHGTVTAAIAAASMDGICSPGIAPGATISSCVAAHPDKLAGQGIVNDALFAENADISTNSWSGTNCEGRRRRRRRRLQECPFPADDDGSPCAVCDYGADNPSDECALATMDYCSGNLIPSTHEGCAWIFDVLYGTPVDGHSDSCNIYRLPSSTEQSILRGITEGRGGKGTVYTFSASNAWGQDGNQEGYMSSRYTISVGAVGKDRIRGEYTTPSSSVFISGPGGSTTRFVTNTPVAFPAGLGGGCTEGGEGTSYATPAVAGVAALMLEANPDLGWRDVQAILASTAQKTDTEKGVWTTNQAGISHSPYYGFGIANAAAAVNAAKTWQNWGPEKLLVADAGPLDIPLPDGPSNPVTSTVTVGSSTESFVVEHVVVEMDSRHSTRGHLEITLTSPQGTKSLMLPGARPENQQYDSRMELMTVKNWGETPDGDWTLSVVDIKEGDWKECVNKPWYLAAPAEDTSGFNATCLYARLQGACSEGEIADETVFELYAEGNDHPDGDGDVAESCCACGGGRPAEEIDDMLFTWKLHVYGHSGGGSVSSMDSGDTPQESSADGNSFNPPFEGSLDDP